jgi:dTDP-4-amino-4,6-dideoxygalactose transaminase
LVSRDTEALVDLAKQHNLWLIEDCAHATGAEFRGRKVGNFGDVAVFSSEQSKVFNTNQGGIAATNSPLLARRLDERWRRSPEPPEALTEQQLLNVFLNYDQCKHPQRWWRAEMAEIRLGRLRIDSTTTEEVRGIRPPQYGCRMTAPIARLGLNQLQKIDRYNERRRHSAQRWKEWSQHRRYPTPSVLPGSTPVFLRYPTRVPPDMKKDPSWAERELNVELGVWFVSHVHPSNWRVDDCPNADEAVQSCVNFPTLTA